MKNAGNSSKNKTILEHAKSLCYPLERRKIDLFDILIIIALYSIFVLMAVLNLGSAKTPVTYLKASDIQDYCMIELHDENIVTKINIYYGHENGTATLICKDNDYNISMTKEIELKESFKWLQIDTDSIAVKYIEIKPGNEKLDMYEVAIFGADTKTPLAILSSNCAELTDEQDKAVYSPTYKDEMYFDEIYFSRTAFEFIKGEEPFEWTHPPLGKLLIALGILAAGMNPFGWRIAGVVIGGMAVPAMYLFGVALFKKRKFTFMAATLIMFDFILFVQARIGTADSFLLPFIILMFYFMYCYSITPGQARKKRIINLALSGLFFSLAVSVKWSALYGGIGLALIYLITFLRDITVKKSKQEKLSLIGDNLLNGAIFFMLIPATIYIATYIPGIISGKYDGVMDVLKLQKFMLDYHKNLTATHSFSSRWWEWPLMIKPLWMYLLGSTTESAKFGLKSVIVSFGNPIIWWSSLPAILYSAKLSWKSRDARIITIIIAYFSLYMPWMFITRLTFIYHYMPAIPFAILAIVLVVEQYTLNRRKALDNVLIIHIVGAAIILFAIYYPIISGTEARIEYIDSLKLLKSWVF